MRETPGSIPGSPIAFLYARRPSGHSLAAEALREGLRELAPGVSCAILDLAKDLHPFLGPMVARAYLELVQKAPGAWERLYCSETAARALAEFKAVLSLLHRAKLRTALTGLEPRAAVCTHALPCAILALEKERGDLRLPLVGVITDFGAHVYWASKWVDMYLVASEDIRKGLIELGIQEARVRVTGIPVRSGFVRPPGKAAARRALGLATDAPTLLVSGGTRGIGPVREIVPGLLARLPRAQLVVACGENQRLFDRLQPRSGPRLKVLPYTRDMLTPMAAADLVIGKAGGITVSEALALGLPLLLAPLPGAEGPNAGYVVSRGAALRAEGQAELFSMAEGLLDSPERLGAMSAAARSLGKPGSAAAGAGEILRLLQEPILASARATTLSPPN